MQIPSLRIAKEKGWRVFLADGNPDAEGKKYCDVFLHIDLKDRDSMLDAARDIKKREGLDGVFTAGTDFSTTVAWVAERLGLPGIPYSVALRATDKALMREVLGRSGVPIPDFVYLSGDESPLSLVKKRLGYPLVVKPVDNMGARGVRRVDSDEELIDACKVALISSRVGKVIIEEFMDGPELSIDAIVFKEEVTICGVADRHIYFPPYFVEMGHTMPSNLSDSELRQAVDVFIRGVKAIGIDNGAAKGDIKVTKRGAMVGEIAARLSGGYMSGWTYPYSSGVEVTEKALNIAVGLEPGDMKPKYERVSAERAFISIPGNVQDVEGMDRIKGIRGLKNIFLRVGEGDAVVFPVNNVEKCGNVISVADERREAIAIAERAIKSVFIRLQSNNRDTEDFLFNRGCDRSDYYRKISAFELIMEENIKYFRELKKIKLAKTSYPKPVSKIPSLPDIKSETSRDWHGHSLIEVMERVEELVNVEFGDAKSLDLLSNEEKMFVRLFWEALLKGSVQGAVYVVESFDGRES